MIYPLPPELSNALPTSDLSIGIGTIPTEGLY